MLLSLLLRTTRPFLFDEDASGTGGGTVAPAPSPSPADGGGTSPAPSPSSSPEPSSTPSPQPGGGLKDDNKNESDDLILPDFSDNDDLDNLGNDAVVVPEPGKPPGEPPAKPVVPPAQVPPQPPVAQPPAPVAQPAQPPAPVAEDRPLDPTNPAEVAQMLLNNRDAAVQGLAAQMYALSPEEVEGLENNAVGTIPSLLARVHLNTVAATMNRMAEMVPFIIQRHMQAVGRNSENAAAFYEANPHLSRSDARVSQAVASMARVYRAQNPNANKADMIKAVGLLVSQQLGIAPAAAAPPAPVTQQPSAGFVPAATGGGGISPPAPAPDPWAGLAGDYDED